MASRFWVGGTGTWDSTTTTHWSASTGGAGGASAPTTGDSVTFDGASGGGTVTADGTINNLSLGTLTMGAFTGTLDFATNNPSLTLLVFNNSGTGTRTLNLGSGTFTLTTNGGINNTWDQSTTTGLTFNAGTSTIALVMNTAASNKGFAGGGKTYNNVTIGSGTHPEVQFFITGANTFANLTATGPLQLQLPSGVTQTITNAFTWAGTSTSNVLWIASSSTQGAQATISVASGSCSINWGALANIVFTGGATFTATNSIDLKNNTGVTITGPSGGGGFVIGS